MKAGLQCVEWRKKEGAVFMNYVGVDVHKKYSVLWALDEGGRKLREARVEGNAPSGFAQFFCWSRRGKQSGGGGADCVR